MSPDKKAALEATRPGTISEDQVVHHSGDKVPADAPTTPLPEVAGRLGTPDDTRAIDPDTGQVNWVPLAPEARNRKTFPRWARVTAAVAATGLAATTAAWAVFGRGDSSETVVGPRPVAASPANPGKATSLPTAAQQPGGQSPSPEASTSATTIPETSRPISPEALRASEYPTFEEAAPAMLNLIERYRMSGNPEDLSNLDKPKEELGLGDPALLEAILGPDYMSNPTRKIAEKLMADSRDITRVRLAWKIEIPDGSFQYTIGYSAVKIEPQGKSSGIVSWRAQSNVTNITDPSYVDRRYSVTMKVVEKNGQLTLVGFENV